MLSVDQLTFFGREGYLVIEDVFDQAAIVDPVRAEYQQLLDRLYNQWYQQGRVGIAPDGLSFEEKLKISYAAKCDWFQPMEYLTSRRSHLRRYAPCTLARLYSIWSPIPACSIWWKI